MTKWKPQTADYQAAVKSQNPWQILGTVPKELSPNSLRPLARVLWRQLVLPAATRHQIILGPRRVGKTTVMYQTVSALIEHGIRPNRLWWLRLDHPLLMDWPLGDLVQQIIQASNATAREPAFVFLDELTYADRWDLWLKTFFDEHYPVRIVGTSSATAAMRQRGTESGVGRWDEQYLAPYLFTEYLDLVRRRKSFECGTSLGDTIGKAIDGQLQITGLAEDRRRFLLTGGFPELLLSEKRPDEASELLRSQRVLRSDAIEKAIYKDIPQAFKIDDPTKLERLLYVLAGQMTGVMSTRTIATDIQSTAPTVERYVGFLERAFMVFTLQNYSPTEESIQRRGKRLYFVDGAVRNAALLRGIAPLGDSTERGILVENMAASHLRALAYQEQVRLYYWRQKDDLEVDLVYDHPDDPLAFEVTASASHHYKGLMAFQQKFARFRGRCYLVSESTDLVQATDDRPGRLPLDVFLVLVGCQEQRALENRIGKMATAEGNQLLLF
jgi:predicted AAA+ superfamily ATPase